jgi:hypothetical protein
MNGIQVLQSGAAFFQPLGNSERNAVKREQHFIFNLEKMAGRTDAVTLDVMIEFCFHVHDENLIDPLVQQIEQDYLATIFNDQELNIVVCSIEVRF